MELSGWILVGVGGLFGFMVMSKSVMKPLRWIWWGILYSVVGAVVLFLLNLAGRWVDFQIPINPITALITGALGVPGLIYLIVVKALFIM
ncbi:pro-sigmaK processing inhibitor BofA family protein [Mechercharimyces sp. CAU 1602]|uniref:pro-sigmaK processing inhibitor BofA family protein n=1 Tax=Mechercharimyces sp. CAU 1602 TaxID=2973933 RepID=UPI0021614035|nr:pro-sigmaK processing inhibitor BofA family protein [Mechercharimyces sp. CAU 1602]MCS1352747.1 pro-sigmaK processing inhibitor BofA family protein [Mechercharimyces sp. CAU 1602]